MVNYYIHIPRTGGTSLASSLPHGCAEYLGHDLRSVDYAHPGTVCTAEDYTFTIVRDPFDRLVSSFRFLANGGFSESDRADAERLGIADGAFRDFVVHRLADAATWQIHFRPQSFYLHGVPNPHVYDFADKHRALAEISVAVGVHPAPALEDRNKSVGSETTADEYDEQCREVVRAVYREDFELLASLKGLAS